MENKIDYNFFLLMEKKLFTISDVLNKIYTLYNNLKNSLRNLFRNNV